MGPHVMQQPVSFAEGCLDLDKIGSVRSLTCAIVPRASFMVWLSDTIMSSISGEFTQRSMPRRTLFALEASSAMGSFSTVLERISKA